GDFVLLDFNQPFGGRGGRVFLDALFPKSNGNLFPQPPPRLPPLRNRPLLPAPPPPRHASSPAPAPTRRPRRPPSRQHRGPRAMAANRRRRSHSLPANGREAPLEASIGQRRGDIQSRDGSSDLRNR